MRVFIRKSRSLSLKRRLVSFMAVFSLIQG
jgi:hypothetical protein